ncbi:hypothetical protein CBR_g37692 [Chara braunii]|uniref:Nuclear pore complex protein Nup205 n=1 Tax=Chara braunii TaxID=69332 RepID=A0A388JZV3_CHABU|nr:hypothetical protein CBR_g37692 [Chara braunii]|eukprot:GBG63334.1 hypothetical protein CBR_g37692 [Chara braunii]
MYAHRTLLEQVECLASGAVVLTGQQKADLSQSLQQFEETFRNLLSHAAPRAEDRAQVQAKEVRLRNARPMLLDEQDVQIALKLSDDYNLNELDAVSLLVAAHQEWSIVGRDPVEVLQMAAGIYLEQRRCLLTSLMLLLRVVVLEQDLQPDVIADVRDYVMGLLATGLRKRMITLVKELGREEGGGIGAPEAEPHVMDMRGVLVERKLTVHRERALLCQCIIYSCLIDSIAPSTAKDLFALLKDCALDWSRDQSKVKRQIAYTVMFALVNSLISDSLGGIEGDVSVLAADAGFRHDFHEQIMASPSPGTREGFVAVVRMAWTVFIVNTTGSASTGTLGAQMLVDDSAARACLDRAIEGNSIHFLVNDILRTPAFQNDDPDLINIHMVYLHKMLLCFFTHSVGRDKVKDMKDAAIHNPDLDGFSNGGVSLDANNRQQPRQQSQAQQPVDPFLSFLDLVGEVYQTNPDLMVDNQPLWMFVMYAGEDHRGFRTLVAFLEMLTALATSEVGARQVHGLLQGRTMQMVSWHTLFHSLNVFDSTFRQAEQKTGRLPEFRLGDAKALEAYLRVLKKVMEEGKESERAQWFPDIEPLFKLLPYENVPLTLKGALRNAIAAFIPVSAAMRDHVWGLYLKYDVVLTAPIQAGPSAKLTYDMVYELNEVEARSEEYPSTLSYLGLLNSLIAADTEPSDQGRRYSAVFRFVRDHVFSKYAQRGYAQVSQKWEIAVAALTHFHRWLAEDWFGADQKPPPHGVVQSIDRILAYDNRQIVFLLEYVRYNACPDIQKSAIRIMSILSACIQRLVPIILEARAVSPLVEDYAACLEASAELCNMPEEGEEDEGGFLIMQLLLANLDRPAPNVTHLLLKFDVENGVDTSFLQPRRDYSCLRVILDILDSLARPKENFRLHEFGFQLMYELCVDPLTCGPTIELLRNKKYEFFSKHLLTKACEPLPKRSTHQAQRVSSLQQRAWLLKLVALELHVADVDMSAQRDSCRDLLTQLFRREPLRWEEGGAGGQDRSPIGNGALVISGMANGGLEELPKTKVLELLDIVQFQLPEPHVDFPREMEQIREELAVTDILADSATVEEGGVYKISERGDRLIDIDALKAALWQECKRLETFYNIGGMMEGQRQAELREVVQRLIKWAWKRNKHMEEQAAQLHVLVGWAQLVEVAISRRYDFLGNNGRPQLLFEVLDAALNAAKSPDCSLKMAFPISQVAMTVMAKLREQIYSSPGAGDSTDDVSCVDLLSASRLANNACHTILMKLVQLILKGDTSEPLRRRNTLKCCFSFFFLRVVCDDHQLDKEQAELIQGNFAILRKEAMALTDVAAKDATHGSDVGKALAFYVLEALLSIDNQQIFFNQLLSRGLLQSCLGDVSTSSYQAVLFPSTESLRRLYTLEAELALLNRVAHHNRTKGAQTLMSMGILQYLANCRALDVQLHDGQEMDSAPKVALMAIPSQRERHHQILTPVLRLVLALTTLIDVSGSNPDQGPDEVALQIIEFLKQHEGITRRMLDDARSTAHPADLEELQLTTAILAKVWPLEIQEKFLFMMQLFQLSQLYFSLDADSRNKYIVKICESKSNSETSTETREVVRKLEHGVARVRRNLVSYLRTLVTKQGHVFHCFRTSTRMEGPSGIGTRREIAQPTLKNIADLLQQSTQDLMEVLEEKGLLLTKLRDVNELSRHEVDEIIKAYAVQDLSSSSDTIRRRRFLGMLEMVRAAASRELHLTDLLAIIEHALEILYIHFDITQSSTAPRTYPAMNSPTRSGPGQRSLRTPSRNVVSGDDNEGIGSREDFQRLGQRLLPVLEVLEGLTEVRLSRSTQYLQHVVHGLKTSILYESAQLP